LNQLSKVGTKAQVLLVLGGFALAACSFSLGPRSPSPPASRAPTAGSPPASDQWAVPDTNDTQYRADLESCYDFAQARIAEDERTEIDSSAAFDASPSGLGVTELSGRMSEFERKNRRSSLYGECMRAKGYVEQ